ncbi:MAG: PQQ-binding-like beta-propeller repeat protein [Acidimicrobiales bacterium]
MAVALIAAITVIFVSGGSPPPTGPAHRAAGSRAARLTGPDSVEAGVEPWQVAAPVSREAVAADGAGLTVLGGITPSGTSLPSVTTINPATGAITEAGSLAEPVHDAAASVIGHSTFVLGGGSPDTVDTVQSFPSPSGPGAPSGTGEVAGHLPQPRSDLAVATLTDSTGNRRLTTAYIVGGYDGTTYLPNVLATVDGTRFTTVATLPVPVRYPAVASVAGRIYAFGGQVQSQGVEAAATADIQMIDPATHRASVVGNLPQPLYGASAFLLDGTIYVAGGQVPGGATLTQIDAFVPSTGKVLDAGLLPQADAFAGYTTVDSGHGAIGYMVGGEVTAQTGTDQAGVASGSLQSVMSLRLSRYGGLAGQPGAGAPYSGTLLIADRGNDRLIALDARRDITWQYPSAQMPPPAGGFYFPDDAFFIKGGTGIISNQEDNHTIVEIGYPSGRILWQYGHPGQPGSAPGYLDQPDDAYLLKSGTITVADASNNRILFISPGGQIIGQIGNGADAHDPPTSIAYPNGDTPLLDGNVLVSEINGSWIDEYTPTGTLVWTVHLPTVNYPSDPQQLGPDLYLMTDYDPPAEGRALEFTRSGNVTWLYDATSGDAMLKKPSLAERLPNGLIMLNDDYRDRVVVIDPTNNSIVWQYGLTDVAGTAPGLVSIPDGFDNLLPNGTTPTHPNTG